MTSDRADLYAWIALLALLGITCASAYLPMGTINAVVNLAVAATKAFVVAIVFMRLGKERPLIRLVAAIGVIWLVLLAGLSATDFAARGG